VVVSEKSWNVFLLYDDPHSTVKKQTIKTSPRHTSNVQLGVSISEACFASEFAATPEHPWFE
jgi:hypothetical protein